MNVKIKKIIIGVALSSALAAFMFALSGCALIESIGKDFESDTVKLDRQVELYDYNGELLKTWEGEMRIESGSSQSCSFIIDGKRTTINGGIIITQEK